MAPRRLKIAADTPGNSMGNAIRERRYPSANPENALKTLVSRSAAVFASALWDEGQVNELRTKC